MTEQYVHLSIDDYPFSTREGLIPCSELPQDLVQELLTMKRYEHQPLLQLVEQGRGYAQYRDNPDIPDLVHQIVRKWYDILDGKPHVIGPEYMHMAIDDDMDNEGFQEYKVCLYNNLPNWYKNIVIGQPTDQKILYQISLEKRAL